jgi:hypothetical protein
VASFQRQLAFEDPSCSRSSNDEDLIVVDVNKSKSEDMVMRDERC